MTEKAKVLISALDEVLKMMDGVDNRSKKHELLSNLFDDIKNMLLTELANHGGHLSYGKISSGISQKTC
jgi:hypothetical protein